MASDSQRYAELDLLRGLAVLSMALYHLCFDLVYFYGRNIPIGNALFDSWAKGTATAFLLLMGTCFTISWSRTSSPSLFRFLIRGFTIFSGGMAVTLVTWFVAPDAFVKFGILHLIGVSALLQPLFARFGLWNAVIGVLWTIIGVTIASLKTSSPFLFPIGITSPAFASLDYYPLFPWFGVILIGMGIGSLLYAPRRPFLETCDRWHSPRWILWTGRRALLLYFLHQPLLLLMLTLMLGLP